MKHHQTNDIVFIPTSYNISRLMISIIRHHSYVTPPMIHQAPGVSPRQRGPGTPPATRYFVRGDSPVDRWEDKFGRQAVCSLVEEKILHQLRHLPGPRPAGSGAG